MIPASGLPPSKDMVPGSVAWSSPTMANFSRRRRRTRPCVCGIRAHGGSVPNRCAVTVMKCMRWHSLRTRRCLRREAKTAWSCSGTRAPAHPQGAGARSPPISAGQELCPIARHCWQSMMCGLNRLSIWRRCARPPSACPRQDPRLRRPIISPFLTELTPSNSTRYRLSEHASLRNSRSAQPFSHRLLIVPADGCSPGAITDLGCTLQSPATRPGRLISTQRTRRCFRSPLIPKGNSSSPPIPKA